MTTIALDSSVWSSLHCSSTLWLTLLAGVLVFIYRFWKEDDDSWARYGIKCPKLPRMYFFVDDFRGQFSNLLNRYGDKVGLKFNDRMILVTSDLNLLKHVMIKDFNNFVDRGDRLASNSHLGKSLFFTHGNDWRRNRHITSPTFSTGKLKYISKAVEKSAEKLACYLEEFARDGKLVPIKDMSGRYTCELIAKTAFGLNADFLGQKNMEFYEYTKNMLHTREGFERYLAMVLFRIPYLMRVCNKLFPGVQFFEFINVKANAYFDDTLKDTISKRRQQRQQGINKSHSDFLDLLLSANEAAQSGQLEATGDEENDGNLQNKETRHIAMKGMSDEEMLGHSTLVIFAGFETTSTTLQMCLYELAVNQDVQDRVYQEILTVVKSDNPTPDHLKQLTYTEQVINETLRMYPPLASVSRKAKETKTYDGITIPQGKVVMIPLWHILMDPKIWPDPQKFDPDRFSPEEKEKRDPLAFMAFGQGPRLCLGMRLAYLELKMALVHVLRKVKVVLNEKTEPKKGSSLEVTYLNLLTPKTPIMLGLELRGNDKVE